MTYTEEIFKLSAPYDNPYQGPRKRYLFVCSAGLLRSPTAAAVAIQRGHNARSCGSADYALIPLSINLIEWAHKIIFVNEANYFEALDTFKINSDATCSLADKRVVWPIEDEFNYMDPDLVIVINKLLDAL